MEQNQACQTFLLISPETMTEAETVSGLLDCDRCAAATIHVAIAANGTVTELTTVSLLEDDTTVVTDFATVVANVTVALSAAHAVTYHVDRRGRARYLRLTVTTGAATNCDTVVAAVANLYKMYEAPGGTADMRGSTNDTVVIVT